MKIEWDIEKRNRTLEERGIDFADVEFLDWTTALTLEATRDEYGERRFVTIGLIRNRLHVLVWTPRVNTVRIISLRKANKREIKRYGQS